MRQCIAISSLCSLLALTGCYSTVERIASPPAVTHPDDGAQAVVRASAPQDPAARPPQPSSLGEPDGARQIERTNALPPAPSVGSSPPIQSPPAGIAPTPAPPAASPPQESAPCAEEFAQALKEDEDALATLRTAGRALEASHKRLEALLKRQGAAATTPFSFYMGVNH